MACHRFPNYRPTRHATELRLAPRASRRLEAAGAYFITAATYKKQHQFNSRERLDVLQRGLFKLTARDGWQLTAWAIFSNHYHFIAAPKPGIAPEPLGRLLSELHSKTAIWANKVDKQSGRMICYNFRDIHLSFQKSYYARLHYVHANPVHHGLVLKPEDYPWCSAAWFKRTAKRSFVETIESFKTDRLNAPDDFEPEKPV